MTKSSFNIKAVSRIMKITGTFRTKSQISNYPHKNPLIIALVLVQKNSLYMPDFKMVKIVFAEILTEGTARLNVRKDVTTISKRSAVTSLVIVSTLRE